jgi:hypothetical protein
MAMTISGSTGVVFPDGTSQASGQQACKAWVNFNGTGTVAIRAAYNVTSITDNGTGLYTVNVTTAFSDTNYAWSGNWGNSGASGANQASVYEYGTRTTSSLSIQTTHLNTATYVDPGFVSVVFFR